MKKLITLLLIAMLLFLFGCEESNEPDLAAPQNIELTVVQNGAGIRIDWDTVSEANAYYLYYGISGNPDSLRALCKVIAPNYFYHDSTSLENAGYYAVRAVGGDYDATSGPLSEIVSSAPVKTAQITLYERDHSGGNSSAFGWNMTTGEGFVTSVNEASTRWFCYLDDGVPGASVDSLFRLVVPDEAVGSSTPPDVPWGNTGITQTTDSYSPKTIIDGYAPEVAGIYEDFLFYLLIDGEYYAKLQVKEILSNGIVFDAYFQPMEGFRKF